ncbi:MAG: hypothetical protein ACRDQ2_19235 [Gaiellales bacterium]
MIDVEDELRQVMRERARTLASAPPLRSLFPESESLTRQRHRRRAVVVVATAAVLTLAAGIALAQILEEPEPPTVTPAGDRLVVASGETDEGPWQLTAYRAQLAGTWWTGSEHVYGVRTARCLDLDGPGIEEPGEASTQQMNSCTFDGQEELIEHIGAHARVPDFVGREALVYGEVSAEVARLEIAFEDGRTQEVAIVPAPDDWNLPVGYFATFVPSSGKVGLVARNDGGEVLEEERI